MKQNLAHNEPSVTSALERVVQASERIVADRMDLVFLEIRGLIGATFEGLIALGMAVGLLLISWVALVSMMVFVLLRFVPDILALAIVAAFNLIAGAVLMRRARVKIEEATRVADVRPDATAATP